MTDAFFCHVRPPHADTEPRLRLTPAPAVDQSDDSYVPPPSAKERLIEAQLRAAEVRSRRPSMQVTRKTPWFEWCAS